MFKHCFVPTFQSQMSKLFRFLESLWKSNGKKWPMIWKLLVIKGVKSPHNFLFCFSLPHSHGPTPLWFQLGKWYFHRILPSAQKFKLGFIMGGVSTGRGNPSYSAVWNIWLEPPSQLFQSSILIMDIATYRLNPPRGQCSDDHLKCITRWEGRDGVTITAYKRWTEDRLFIKRRHHKDLKLT